MCFSKNGMTLRKPKKNLRKESWQRTSGTTKWDKLGQVGVVGQVGQGEGSLQIFVGQVGQGQGVCPLQPFHLSQMGLQGLAIFGPLSQTHISERVFMNKISSSTLLYIQLTLFCVCGVDSFLPQLEHLYKNVFTVCFPKRRVRNLGVFLRFWVETEVNFFHKEKFFRRDCLDYLKNRAKSGDMALLERLEMWVWESGRKFDPATGVLAEVTP